MRDALFAEATFHAAYEPQRAVRTKRWKYIRRFDGRDRPVLPNTDDSLSKDVLLRYGWAERRVDEEQLFDLVFDPNEAANLAYDPEHADGAARRCASACSAGWRRRTTRCWRAPWSRPRASS